MCQKFKKFGHFGNLVNQIKGSGGDNMKFLTFDTSLNKLKHPRETALILLKTHSPCRVQR